MRNYIRLIKANSIPPFPNIPQGD